MMQAEVVSIGDELASGQRLDTNSQWLSRELGELGVRTIRHTTVCDDLAENIDAFKHAVDRADIVVCTGGLGPTQDDLTRQAIAEAFDCPLELDQPSLERIQEMFASRNREMPPQNRVQALFPRGSQVIFNPHGSAPGVDLAVRIGEKVSRIFALPGVPAEMKQMWRDTVVPRIEAMQGDAMGRWRYRAIKLFGIGESDVEVKLPDLILRSRVPSVGITVSRATITLRIAGRSHSDEEFDSLIAPTLSEIQSALGELVFGEGDDELEHATLRLLDKSHLRLASLEVGAASWISDWMLQADDPRNAHYAGGVAFPTVDAASRWLSSGWNSNEETSAARASMADQADSQKVWIELAEQTRRRFRADLALAVGIYPTIAEMETLSKAFDCVVAVAGLPETLYQAKSMGGHPDVLGPRIAKTGLDFLRKQLQLLSTEQKA